MVIKMRLLYDKFYIVYSHKYRPKIASNQADIKPQGANTLHNMKTSHENYFHCFTKLVVNVLP
jgi:hypothetical protein